LKKPETGYRSSFHKLPATAPETELLELVERLNHDPTVHGILVQLPLPPQIDSRKVIETIAPAKDVDGFHPLTAGLLYNRSTGHRAVHAACLHHARKESAWIARWA
jgi:methylenetetrahydrofolate dehydrogenase (NADP+) / methenyltetrahydrofolate cyclohydrolase